MVLFNAKKDLLFTAEKKSDMLIVSHEKGLTFPVCPKIQLKWNKRGVLVNLMVTYIPLLSMSFTQCIKTKGNGMSNF